MGNRVLTVKCEEMGKLFPHFTSILTVQRENSTALKLNVLERLAIWIDEKIDDRLDELF